MRAKLVAAIIIASSSVWLGGAQQPALSVTGTVIDAVSGKALADATVVATTGRTTPPNVAVLTDLTGHFSFPPMAAGEYRITATKSGYLAGGYGQNSPSGTVQPVTVTGSLSGLRIALWQAAEIEGRIFDRFGEPAASVHVLALRRTFPGGRARLLVAGATRTDDRGRFRFGGLFPGSYNVLVPAMTCTLPTTVLQAFFSNPTGGFAELQRELSSTGVAFVPPGEPGSVLKGELTLLTSPGLAAAIDTNGEASTYEPAAYPSSLTPFSVGLGQTRELALTLQTASVGQVAGFLNDSDRRPIASALLALTPTAAFELGGDRLRRAITLTESSGRFRFAEIPPGEYVVTNVTSQSSGPTSAAKTSYVYATVSVTTGGFEGLSLTADSGHSVSGRIVLTTDATDVPKEKLGAVTVFLERVDGLPAVGRLEARANPEGAFTIRGVPPAKYFVRAITPAGLFLSASRLNEKDVSWTALPVETDITDVSVELTGKQAVVSGTVALDPGTKAIPTVYVFPLEQSSWIDFGSNPRRIRAATTDSKGAYVLSGLPNGEYFFAAVPPGVYDPETEPRIWFGRLSAVATRVTVRDGIATAVNLRVTNPR